MNNILDYLKNKQLVWQGNHNNNVLAAQSSGYPELDAHLEGGLPEQGMLDIHSDTGIGELRLFLPYLLQRQIQQQRLMVIIAPPLQINSEMLAEAGFALERILVIQPDSAQDALWAAEQCLKSGCCHSVLSWQNELEIHQVKRLQLAAKQGNSLHFVFRNQQSNSLSLPVTMSLQLAPSHEGISIKINKRIGSWNNNKVTLNMRQHWPVLTQPETQTTYADNLIPFPNRRVS